MLFLLALACSLTDWHIVAKKYWYNGFSTRRDFLLKPTCEKKKNAFHEQLHTRNMKLSSRDDKLSGLGLVGPADIHASMMAPCVPNHQVGCDDDHICGHWLPICTETDKKKRLGRAA